MTNTIGQEYERKIAGIIRRTLKLPATRDKRSGAAWYRRSDIYVPGLPYHFEVKHHQTIKVKEWFRQAESAAPGLHTPVLIFQADENDLCVLRLPDFLNMVKEIREK